MKEYIEREALIEKAREVAERYAERHRPFAHGMLEGFAIFAINEIPAADVVERVRGEWIDKFNKNRMTTQSFCSACGKHSGIGGIESNRHKPFCPNCGADMRGEKHDR